MGRRRPASLALADHRKGGWRGAQDYRRGRNGPHGDLVVTEEFEDAFPALYLRARRVAARILKDWGEAEEAAAEALVRTLAAWKRVGALPYRDAWVLSVTANVAVDMIRRRQRAQLIARFELGDRSAPDDIDDRMLVVTLLGELPRRQREVLVLKYLVDLAEDDVAACLAISRGAVKRHAQRGLTNLRRLMDSYGQGG